MTGARILANRGIRVFIVRFVGIGQRNRLATAIRRLILILGTSLLIASGMIAVSPANADVTSGSIEFDGSNLIRYPSSENLSLPGDYTVELWVKYSSFWGGNTILSRWTDGDGTGLEYKLTNYNGGMGWFQRNSAGDVSVVAFETPSRLNWHHIAAVRSGTTITVYVDGVAAGSTEFSGAVAASRVAPLEIGGRSKAAGGNDWNYFAGRLSNLRITQSALYTGSFTPSITQLEPVTGTTLLLNAQSSDVAADSSGLASPYSVQGEPIFSTDTPFDTGIPQPPTDVQGTSATGTSSVITWGASSDVFGQGSNSYDIYQSDDGVNFSPTTGCQDIVGITCTATGLVMAHAYVFKGSAANLAGTSAYSLMQASGVFPKRSYDYLNCAEQNVFGTNSCSIFSSRNPYTTAVLPTPSVCTELDGIGQNNDSTGADVPGAFDADGNMYFSHGDTIRKITLEGFQTCTSSLFSDSNLLHQPDGRGMVLDAEGNLFVANGLAGSEDVIKISSDGSSSAIFLPKAVTGGHLLNLVFDSDQNLLALSGGGYNNKIVKFSNTAPTVKTTLVQPANGFLNIGGNQTITGFSLNSSDQMITLINANDDYVVVFDPDFDVSNEPFYSDPLPSTVKIWAHLPPYTWANRPFADSEGNTWLPASGDGQLLKLDPTGKVLLSSSIFNMGVTSNLYGCTSVTDVKIDPNGNLWVKFGNCGANTLLFQGATRPFLRQLTYKGNATVDYGKAHTKQIVLDGATGSVSFKTTNGFDFTVSSSGYVNAGASLSPGKHVVSGTAKDSVGIAGTWRYVINVEKAQPTLGLSSATNPSVFGNSVTFTATPSVFDSGTTISFFDSTTLLGTCTVTSVSCQYSTSALSRATHAIHASIESSAHYKSAISADVNQEVGKVSTSTTFAVSANPLEGSTITLTATVNKTAATGSVTFKDYYSNVLCTVSSLTLGVGSCDWTGSPAKGTYSVQAFYSGDESYNWSNSFAANVVIEAKYTVTFDYNGATANTTDASMDFTTGGSALTLPVPIKSGYAFDGWFVSSGFTESALGGTYSPAGSLTIYAKWRAAVVTYNYNSADGGNSTVTDTYASSAITLPTPTRTGYTFGGWFVASDLSGSALGPTYTPSTDITLNAKWTQIIYFVTYHYNGATSGNSLPGISFPYGNPALTLPTPTRTGYTFGGWFEASDLSGSQLGTTYTPTAVVDLYAKWTANTYTVTYNYNSADGGNTVVSSTYTTDATDITLPTPTRTGYTFGGWFVSSLFTGSALGLTYNTTEDITLHAKWNVDSHTVSFDAKGGSTVSDGSFDTGGTVTLPSQPTKAGYKFEGWSSTDGGTALLFPYTPGVTSNITLYALWSGAVVTYNYNSADSGNATLSDTYAGAAITLPVPTRTGYTFGGWFASNVFAGSAVGATYTPTSDVTLYASWQSSGAPLGVKATGSGSTNYGAGSVSTWKFEAEKRKLATPSATHKGELTWSINRKWKFTGSVKSYTLQSGLGVATANGTLWFWKNNRWVVSSSNLLTTFSFRSRVANVSPAQFGIDFGAYNPPIGQGTLPSSVLRNVAAGSIFAR